jgi:hypothetical protein
LVIVYYIGPSDNYGNWIIQGKKRGNDIITLEEIIKRSDSSVYFDLEKECKEKENI